MQKLLNIDNLGLKGLNTDQAPWDLPAEFITSGINFRVFANSILSVGGSQEWSNPGTPFGAGHILHVGALASNFWMIPGSSKVMVYDGTVGIGGWSDVSNVLGYSISDSSLWTSCMIGSVPIINHPDHGPEYWSPQSVSEKMKFLDFSSGASFPSVNKSFKIIRSHRNFLFALNLTEDGVDLPSSFRWSHPAENNGLPYTWDEDDLSGIAGISQLGGQGGQIIDGYSLRDSFCIYSEKGIDLLSLSGDEFIWRRKNLSSTVGLLNKNCIAEIKGRHFILADGDIITNDGNSLDSIVHNRIRRRMNSQINADTFDKSFVTRNNALKEIWFCVPEDSSPFPNIAYVYNWKDDSWSIRDLPSNNVDLIHAGYGPQSDPPETYDTVLGTYDTSRSSYGSQKRTPLDDTIIGVDNITSALHILDVSGTNEAREAYCRIERTNFPLEGHRQVTTITRLYPHMSGTEPVQIEVGSQDYAGGAIRWSPPAVFIPGTDRKIDVRSTGELHCWRITSIGSGHWSISGMGFEYTPNGLR